MQHDARHAISGEFLAFCVCGGPNPNSSPVTSEINTVKSRTGPSILTSAARVVNRSANFTRTRSANGASASPTAPPAIDSSMLSVNN